MSKKKRLEEIKQLIKTKQISTQEDIKLHLEEKGICVTQATLSRDLREIGLIKLRSQDGKLYYSLTEHGIESFGGRIRAFIQKVSRAQFMLVLNTNLGEADVLANIIDQEGREEILGTVAGANTLLVICQNEESAKAICQEITVELQKD